MQVNSFLLTPRSFTLIKVVFCLIPFLNGCGSRGSPLGVSWKANPNLVLKFQPAYNVDGLGWMNFYSKTRKEYLWIVDLHEPTRYIEIQYGVIPKDSEQMYPKNGKPPKKLQSNEEVWISIWYARGENWARRGGKDYFLLTFRSQTTFQVLEQQKDEPNLPSTNPLIAEDK